VWDGKGFVGGLEQWTGALVGLVSRVCWEGVRGAV